MLKINFDGYAMGGLAVGESQSAMFKILKETTHLIHQSIYNNKTVIAHCFSCIQNIFLLK